MAAAPSSSVESISRSKTPDCCAASIVYAISGLPCSGLTFLPGSPFEPPRAVMRPRTFTLPEVVPRNQRVLLDRTLGDAAHDLRQLARRNARARPLHPDVVGGDGPAGGNLPERHDAVQRHVPHVLLTRLNLLRRAARLLDGADAADGFLQLRRFDRSGL